VIEDVRIKILGIINYHLNIKKIFVKIDDDIIYLYNNRKTTGVFEIDLNSANKEIAYSIINYYLHVYINMDEKFLNIYRFLLENKDVIDRKNILYSSINTHFKMNEENSILFFAIIIYKSLINLSLNSNILIDYKNSDDILNECCNSIYNFFIYFNIKFLYKKNIRTF